MDMDPETRAYTVALLSIVLAPALTFLATWYRAKRLGITKDNAMELADRASFRSGLMRRNQWLEKRVDALQEDNAQLRAENAVLTVRLERLEKDMILYRAKET